MLILTAALVMSVLGLIFGALLGVTGRVFKVPANEKAEALRECLPGANCGACGYPGCDGYAAAVADGKAEVGACAVGGPACAAKMGEIMGVSVSASVRMVASVACQGYGDHCKPKAEYQGMTDCVAASMVNNGTKACQYACLGLGTCERACPFDAIHIDPIKQIAVVDEEKCQGCKKCVAACPQRVLSMRPAGRTVNVGCHNPEKGIALKEKCDRACIGCEACHQNNGVCVQKDDMAAILGKMIAADVIVMATPVYFYTMDAQMKTLIDRCVARYTEISNKAFYFIATAADGEKRSLERTIEGFRGFLYCLEGAQEKGIVYGSGAWKKGDIKESPALNEAYEMGRHA